MATYHYARNTYLTKHHILAKKRGGTLAPYNTLRLWRDKHDAWHSVFGSLNLDEIINGLYCQYRTLMRTSQTKQWQFLFKGKTIPEVIALLKRTRKIKRSLKKKKHGNNV